MPMRWILSPFIRALKGCLLPGFLEGMRRHPIIALSFSLALLDALSACGRLRPRPDRIPPLITISGVKDGGEYNPGSVLIPVIKIRDNSDPHPVLRMTLNNKPYQPGTPITTPGIYSLDIEASDKYGNRNFESILFQILEMPRTRVSVSTVHWLYRPYPNGYADLEAEFLLRSPTYSLDKIPPKLYELHLFVFVMNSRGWEEEKWFILPPKEVWHLKDRSSGKTVAALVRFQESHRSREIEAGTIREDADSRPQRLCGCFLFDKPVNGFDMINFDEKIQTASDPAASNWLRGRSDLYKVLRYRRK